MIRHGLETYSSLISVQGRMQRSSCVGCGSCGCNEIKEDRELGVPMRQAVEWVQDTTFDLWHLLHPDKGNRQKEVKHWRRPVIGWIKCNVDGAFQERDSTGATGIVLRNHAGEFIDGRAS
jgi:hypothetical protein